MKVLIAILICAVCMGEVVDLDNESLVRMHYGGTVSFEISSNPTTGYIWFLEPDESGVIKSVDPRGEYTRESDLIGGGGKQRFDLFHTAVAKGGETIAMTLVKKRPSESEPVETKKFSVEISPNIY